MFKDPFHWFPDPIFSTIFAVFVFGTYIIDYAIPKMLAARQTGKPSIIHDRSSFLIIQAAGIVSIAAALYCRYMNRMITPAAIQYFGLLLIPMELGLRGWSIIKLGRFFSRTVELEAGHRLITDGPYRRFRHPAYTGMILIDLGIALALGSWLGTLITLVLILGATIYRIVVEEKMLIAAFGGEYVGYMKRTWRLFPGW